jgi:prevent-host-death family protein
VRTASVHEAKTHLGGLPDVVAGGENITITMHGVPVGRLVPAEEEQECTVDELISELREFRRGRTLGDVAIRELIDEGRCY